MKNETVICIVMIAGCGVCEKLCILLDRMIKEFNSNDKNITIKIEYIMVTSILKAEKYTKYIRVFPTIFAYKNKNLRLGWEGFAALAPDEIKHEMVEDVLRQVAALADEDDCGDLPQEMPHKVRDDN